MISLTDSVAKLSRVGPKKLEMLESMGITSIESLLSYYPIRYSDKRTVIPAYNAPSDKDCLVKGTLLSIRSKRTMSNRSMVECTMRDASAVFKVIFFNMPYIKKTLQVASEYMVYGKMAFREGVRVWTNPEICLPGGERDKRGIIPVYRTSPGITSTNLGNWVTEALARADLSCDWIKPEILANRNICGSEYAYRNIHYPEDVRAYQVAKYRIVYDQLLKYQLAIRMTRAANESSNSDSAIPPVDISDFIAGLPFELTEDQTKCIYDIKRDLEDARPMNRLVQGDVGCGKTVVAEAAIYQCIEAGYQAAMMAPTEILARQHHSNLSKDFGRYGFRVGLLVSNMTAAEKRAVLAGLRDGSIDVVVGTHAIIQKDVEFDNLALVITDEQHRFGVNQRKLFARKGRGVNVCVMSATPIPRTLAATVFGDMDYSIIKSRPSSRKPIITRVLDRASKERAYTLARQELEAGNLIYIVAPSIDSEDENIASVTALYEQVRERFPSYKVALLHGQVDKDEKEAVMQDFALGKIKILVATVVIEVGIDVPDATVIIVENAERFGLAQLHQLRGRVGRSDKQSYCNLICYSSSDNATQRMKAMVETSDGFEISELDYKLRGPGDLMGTMQSGQARLYDLDIIALCSYTDILSIAIEDADKIIADPKGTDLEYVTDFMARKSHVDNSKII